MQAKARMRCRIYQHIIAEWASARSYTERIANLLGEGIGERANGDYFLKPKYDFATVHDDEVSDTLNGNAGRDWFFADLDNIGTDKDKVFRTSAEQVVRLSDADT
jgi:hypothetical protein